jgi:CO dehydrogenase/acetyl-CoA synthase delta subunit
MVAGKVPKGRHMFILTVALIIVAIVAVSVAYVTIRASLQMPEAEDLKIEKVRIDTKRSVLIGVNVTNLSDQPVKIVHVELEKIQAKKIVNSRIFSPPVSVMPAETRFIALSFPLDPEGADYKIMVITSEKTVASYIFGYAAPGR